MQKRVARVEPAERRQGRQCATSELFAHRREKLTNRSNAIRADESVDLDPKRNERDQENQTERAQKPAARNKISRRANGVSPEQSRYRRSEPSITRNELVKTFRDSP